MVTRLWKTKDVYSTSTNELAFTWSTEHENVKSVLIYDCKNKILHTQGIQTYFDHRAVA